MGKKKITLKTKDAANLIMGVTEVLAAIGLSSAGKRMINASGLSGFERFAMGSFVGAGSAVIALDGISNIKRGDLTLITEDRDDEEDDDGLL